MALRRNILQVKGSFVKGVHDVALFLRLKPKGYACVLFSSVRRQTQSNAQSMNECEFYKGIGGGGGAGACFYCPFSSL